MSISGGEGIDPTGMGLMNHKWIKTPNGSGETASCIYWWCMKHKNMYGRLHIYLRLSSKSGLIPKCQYHLSSNLQH